MTADHLYFGWWTDADGNLWFRHDCTAGRDEWRAPPPWREDGAGGVTPSLDCKRCGRHIILRACDRIAPVPT